jgi:hypothetical protein
MIFSAKKLTFTLSCNNLLPFLASLAFQKYNYLSLFGIVKTMYVVFSVTKDLKNFFVLFAVFQNTKMVFFRQQGMTTTTPKCWLLNFLCSLLQILRMALKYRSRVTRLAIFRQLGDVYFGLFSNTEAAQLFELLFSTVKGMYALNLTTKWVWLHFRRFIHKLIWSPWRGRKMYTKNCFEHVEKVGGIKF